MRINSFFVLVFLMIVTASLASPSQAFSLITPTDDQIVRESVRITMPVKSLPSDMFMTGDQKPPEKSRPFISIHVEENGKDNFVAAVSPDAGAIRGDTVVFFWDSKAAYRDPTAPKVDKFFKDGKYILRINVHDAAGKVIDTASVPVQLRNKVPRSSPAPAVSLLNRLQFGQTRVYGISANVQVFEMVSGMGLPIMGGLGMTSDFKVVQTVDDVRNDGTMLLRYRVEKGARVSSFGQKFVLYEGDQFAPQLYRLATRTGKVVKRNVFTRQAQYTITDVLPLLPNAPVKEGDSWPTEMTLKIEGVTNPIMFTGTSILDSFEWQDGQECAKIVSRMTGDGTILLAGGKIRSESSKVAAQMTTFFAYKTGVMVRNQVTLDFPAIILPGAGEPGSELVSSDMTSLGTMIPPDAGEDEVFQRSPRGGRGDTRSRDAERGGRPEGSKKGSVQINLVVRMER